MRGFRRERKAGLMGKNKEGFAISDLLESGIELRSSSFSPFLTEVP